MPKTRKSRRNVTPYDRYGGDTLYLHGHGELRQGGPISFRVPHGVQIFIPWGPGVAISEDVGQRVLDGEGTPVNIDLAWIDRPGMPAFNGNRESGRQHKFFYPMSCPNYTLLIPNGLADHSDKDDVFQTVQPITLKEIVEQNTPAYAVFVWSNCTVLRNAAGQPLTGHMDDLGDL